jgi:hypothetical protein
MIERNVPNPDIPLNAFIGTYQPIVGEPFNAALGDCQCKEHSFDRQIRFWLRAGEQWVCPECGRVYSFDGERIDVREQESSTPIGE